MYVNVNGEDKKGSMKKKKIYFYFNVNVYVRSNVYRVIMQVGKTK
jgi:hypothetical protein